MATHPGAALMDVHKPKPVRNWHDFLKEVGIIVLSICIALTAEQAVEWAHWRNEVSVARKALQEEITSIDAFYVRRTAIAPCAAKQEQEASTILDSLEGKGKAVPFTAFHHGSGSNLGDAEWQSQRSAQVLTHFPHAELALMNRYYAILPSLIGWNDDIGAAWSDLSVLQDPQVRLDPSDIARLRGRLERIHRLEYITILNAYRMLKLSDRLGIARPPLTPGYVDALCNMGDGKTEKFFLKAERRH
jgi:hypothetical protein